MPDDNTLPMLWKLARVTELLPVHDGIVRACCLKLPSGSAIRRPVPNGDEGRRSATTLVAERPQQTEAGEPGAPVIESEPPESPENFKLKQELAAVKARQAKDSAQLHALIARIGSPPESTECHSQNNPNRHATPKIPPSLPTPTDSAVTREEIREMLSALSQQLSQQFSIVFTQHLTQFGARLDSLETRLDTQIAETGGNIRRKRATRSSRTTEDQVPLRISFQLNLRNMHELCGKSANKSTIRY
ncbi:hypothetical protein HPB49_018692 [Dermacentor silvarum]|uniref:Uncharacterized protein n=1 Tax=Dermacentor silvarum TaxID=543639 RepID=A0ACB8CSL9_DERSI|nr:hypothetical protein HPB49_018692 [Dermacentor silvarum]